MRVRKRLYIVVLPLVLVITACSHKNPLIGKWRSDPQFGVTAIFKSDSAIIESDDMLNESEMESKTEYKVENGRVGVIGFSKDTGKRSTTWFKIINHDTVEMEAPLLIDFYRVKN